MKYVVAIAVIGLLAMYLLVSAFSPPAPVQRVISDGPHYLIVEDMPTGMICTIDKTGKERPLCRMDGLAPPPSTSVGPPVGEGGSI